jgi:hypothetical protein
MPAYAKAGAISAVLFLFAMGSVFDTDAESIVSAVAISVVLLLVAAGMALRWPYARIVACILLSITAALSLLSIAFNVLSLFVPPTGLVQVLALMLSLAIGIVSAVSARWLEGAQAKAYFSREEPV